MPHELFDMLLYPFFFMIAGCLTFLLFHYSSHSAHEARHVPMLFLAMMLSGLVAFLLFDVIVFASTSFRFNQVHFAGPFAYTNVLNRPTAVMLSGIFTFPALWFSVRWMSRRQARMSSSEASAKES